MPIMRSVLVIALLAVPASYAEAHIHLLEPLSRTDSVQGDPQKQEHCGDAATKRTTRVTTYKPGQTITVRWAETIQHPGYFRISFQPDGEAFRIPPAVGATGFPNEDLTGMVDPGPNPTGSIILKDRIPDGTTMTEVMLPNMECANCTLQFIQVMTDKPPYTVDQNSDDIYFNCADIALAADAPDPDPSGMPDAGTGGGGGGNNDGNNGGEISGGCSTGNSTGIGALALLGLVGLRRRLH